MMATPATLSAVRRAATKHRMAGAALHALIRAAVADGHSLRAVAEQAGVSHVTVAGIVRSSEVE